MLSNYVIDHIPSTTPCNRRPMLAMNATTITIHNTGNPNSSARNERDWLTNSANDRQASFHIVIDDKGAVECLPLNENAWHSGDGSSGKSGNRTSIGIEICERGNYAKTLDHAVDLVSSMLKARSWGVERLRRHFDWSGKICPRLMYDDGKWTGWVTFKNRVAAKLAAGEDEQPMTTAEKRTMEELQAIVKDQNKRLEALEAKHVMSVPVWAKKAVDAAVAAGIIDTPIGGSEDFYRLITIMYRKGLLD
ncbi:MAG: N-acetylmuramoyl-L-alanine amidase family protein [Candidatus Pristimantibacillus sp.]